MNRTRSLGIGPVGAFMPGEDVMEPAPLVSREMLRAFGPSLLSRMREADVAQQQRWQAGERSPTPMTEDRAWLADDVAGSLLGPMGIMGAIKAYHGSPHRFDRFDMSKIGTGEGAQAFGHGLYFSEAPGVAKTYKAKVAAMHGQKSTIDRRPVDWDNPSEYAAFELWRHNGDAEAAAEFAERTFRNTEAARLLRAGAELPAVDTPGALYTTRLDVEPEDLLDWDAPLSQQSEKVRAAVLAMVPDDGRIHQVRNSDGGWSYLKKDDPQFSEQIGNMSGADFLNSLFVREYGEAGTSQRLREAGIPGIRYLDQGSRASGEGTRNFVIFDDKLIDIEGVE